MLLDIAFLVTLLYGIFQGFSAGFFSSVGKLLKWIMAVILSMKLSYLIMGYMMHNGKVDTAYIPLVAFILMYILVLGLINALTGTFGTIGGEANQNVLKKGMGAMLWTFVISFFFSAFIAFSELSGLMSPRMLASSNVYPYVVDIYPVIKCKLAYLVPAFTDILDSFQSLFADLGRQVRGECCP